MTARQRWLRLAVIAAAIALVVHAGVQRGGVIVDNRLFASRVLAGEFPYTGRLHTPYPPSYVTPVTWPRTQAKNSPRRHGSQ